MEFVQQVMGELNRNLAAERKALSELIDGGSYHLKDGSVIDVSEVQARRIWDACDDQTRIRLRLPIYIGTDIDGEVPAWKVEGLAEATAVAGLLGKRMHREGHLRLYNPDIRELKKLIPDCYIMVFSP